MQELSLKLSWQESTPSLCNSTVFWCWAVPTHAPSDGLTMQKWSPVLENYAEAFIYIFESVLSVLLVKNASNIQSFLIFKTKMPVPPRLLLNFPLQLVLHIEQQKYTSTDSILLTSARCQSPATHRANRRSMPSTEVTDRGHHPDFVSFSTPAHRANRRSIFCRGSRSRRGYHVADFVSFSMFQRNLGPTSSKSSTESYDLASLASCRSGCTIQDCRSRLEESG